MSTTETIRASLRRVSPFRQRGLLRIFFAMGATVQALVLGELFFIALVILYVRGTAGHVFRYMGY